MVYSTTVCGLEGWLGHLIVRMDPDVHRKHPVRIGKFHFRLRPRIPGFASGGIGYRNQRWRCLRGIPSRCKNLPVRVDTKDWLLRQLPESTAGYPPQLLMPVATSRCWHNRRQSWQKGTEQVVDFGRLSPNLREKAVSVE